MDKRNFNCEVMADLITLYADDLCSLNSKELVEEHLTKCDSCKAKLEHYKASLDIENQEVSENVAPMKKVNKKLRSRKIVVIILSVILALILICLGILSYGEATNRCPSFTSISDMAELKRVTKEFCDGNSQPLVNIIGSNLNNYYELKNTEFGDYEAYQAHLATIADEVYEQSLKGKKLKIELSEFYLEPYEDSIVYMSDITNAYYIYDILDENDNVLVSISFIKHKKSCYTVELYDSQGRATLDNLPTDEALLKIALKYSVNKAYNAIKDNTYEKDYIIGPALVIRYYDSLTPEAEQYKDTLSKKLYSLAQDGLCIKDTMYSVDSFDTLKNKWIYKVWFEFEDLSSGKSVIMQSYFEYKDYNFYVIPEADVEILSSADWLTDDQRESLITMFEP